MVRILSKSSGSRRGQAGISLIEVLFGGVMLSVALLAHVSSTFSEFRLLRTERTRSEVLLVTRQFLERMRSDDDWRALYGNLRAMQALAEGCSADVKLNDGRGTLSPTAYYPDFVLPPWLADLRVRVDVPASGDAPPILREDLDLPHFGLPADLNGNGAVDASPRDSDYVGLPVVITFRWHPPGEAAHEIRVSTWLRGHQ